MRDHKIGGNRIMVFLAYTNGYLLPSLLLAWDPAPACAWWHAARTAANPLASLVPTPGEDRQAAPGGLQDRFGVARRPPSSYGQLASSS
jgi:hypothetical protein